MNAVQARGYLNQFRGGFRSRWCGLTGDNFGRFSGHMLAMAGIVQVKYGRAKTAVRKQVRKFTRH